MKVDANLTNTNAIDNKTTVSQQAPAKKSANSKPVNPTSVHISSDNTYSQSLRLSQIAHRFGIAKTNTSKEQSIEQRAGRRERLNAARKQQNLEAIMEFAQQYIDSSSSQEEVDPDWLYQFFDMAETIFSSSMQHLWGKILSIQISKPGTFSLRALKTLNQMTFKEAIMFQHACALMVRDKLEYGGKIITGYYLPASFFSFLSKSQSKSINLSKFKLNYPELLSLIDLNLIYATEIEMAPLALGQAMEFDGMTSKVQIKASKPGLVLTYYKLTQIGNELTKLIATESRPDYFNQLPAVFNPVAEVSTS